MRMKSTLQNNLWSTLNGEGRNTSEDLQAVINSFRAQEDYRKLLKDGEKGKQKESLLAKLAARKAKAQQVRLH